MGDDDDGLHVWIVQFRHSKYGSIELEGPFLYYAAAKEARQKLAESCDWVDYPEQRQVDTTKPEENDGT